VALAARSETGTAAAMFYLAAYALMNIGAFAVVTHLSGKGERFLSVDDSRASPRASPSTAALLTNFSALVHTAFHLRRVLRQVLHLQSRAAIESGVADGAGPAEQRSRRVYYLRILVVMT